MDQLSRFELSVTDKALRHLLEHGPRGALNPLSLANEDTTYINTALFTMHVFKKLSKVQGKVAEYIHEFIKRAGGKLEPVRATGVPEEWAVAWLATANVDRNRHPETWLRIKWSTSRASSPGRFPGGTRHLPEPLQDSYDCNDGEAEADEEASLPADSGIVAGTGSQGLDDEDGNPVEPVRLGRAGEQEEVEPMMRVGRAGGLVKVYKVEPMELDSAGRRRQMEPTGLGSAGRQQEGPLHSSKKRGAQHRAEEQQEEGREKEQQLVLGTHSPTAAQSPRELAAGQAAAPAPPSSLSLLQALREAGGTHERSSAAGCSSHHSPRTGKDPALDPDPATVPVDPFPPAHPKLSSDTDLAVDLETRLAADWDASGSEAFAVQLDTISANLRACAQQQETKRLAVEAEYASKQLQMERKIASIQEERIRERTEMVMKIDQQVAQIAELQREKAALEQQKQHQDQREEQIRKLLMPLK